MNWVTVLSLEFYSRKPLIRIGFFGAGGFYRPWIGTAAAGFPAATLAPIRLGSIGPRPL